jgi:tetratricopeptide (TPR) repeat protein
VYDRYTEPIQFYKTGLGNFKRPISTKNAEAQAYFDQGFQMMYAFAKAEAVRSFRESWKRDADCAICYWGEAWAWGSYLNAPMNAEEAPHAYTAIQKAIALRSRAERQGARVDRRHVGSLRRTLRRDQARRAGSRLRRSDEGSGRAVPGRSRDRHALRGCLFLLEPRRGTRDINDPNVKRLHQVLESVLSRDVHHPGACHLYVHATESTVVPERAEACAEFLGNAIPGASHINHMPSHTWNEVGRWGDSVRSNLEAWHSDLKAAVGEGFAIYPEHNLHMLLYAASYDGQGAIAMRAGKDYAKLMGESFYEVLTLIRFGRFDEVLAVTSRPKPDIQGGLWDFAQGYAHLKQGQADFAQVYLDRVRKTADTSKAQFRVSPAKELLSVVAGILDGEMKRMAGDVSGAIAAFKVAADTQEALTYDEPEPLPFSARHWLGAALVEAKRFSEAEDVYRAELVHHPHNGWSLLGCSRLWLGRARRMRTSTLISRQAGRARIPGSVRRGFRARTIWSMGHVTSPIHT